MTGTILVLVLVPIGALLLCLIALAATFNLAKRNGQPLKMMGITLRHGTFTAEFKTEFYEPRELDADTNLEPD